MLSLVALWLSIMSTSGLFIVNAIMVKPDHDVMGNNVLGSSFNFCN